AERVLAQLVAEAERGLTARTVATVGDLLDAWFEFAERDLSPKAAMETRRVIDGRLRPALGTVPLAKLARRTSTGSTVTYCGRERWAAGRHAGPRYGAASPRHPASSAATGRPLGVDRLQSRRRGVAAQGPAAPADGADLG
ncbi:MAG: hypothetical protein AB7G23_20545, partial [Vicinamibacterales bacterium]